MYFTTEKIARQLPEIRKAIYREIRDIPRFRFYEGECPGAQAPEFDDRAWSEFQVGEMWGGYDVRAWFRARVAIPREWKNRKLALRFLAGPRDGGGSTAEALLYVNGVPLQGIDVWHDEAWLPRELLQRGELSIALKAWSGTIAVPRRRRFQLAQLVWIDEPTECFFYLADAVFKTAQTLNENDLRRVRLLQALDESFRGLDFSRPQSPAFYQSVQASGQSLEKRVDDLQTDELKPRVIGIGHAHIDMAWLWRLKATREKAARTFSTALHLMRQYPEYRFLHSSPQLYEYLKRDQPEIFAQVQERIASGEWEITGGMWIEPDTNIPGGESLVRQILFGKRYMRREFGVDTKVVWLPDVFGYSYALPQLMRQSGLKYFLTTKLSWNQYNRFPYDTFHWRGLDGSKVLAHFGTTPSENERQYTYNGELEPYQVKGIWEEYKQKELNDELLFIYGWGDGGGGPTKQMLERARVLNNLPGMPHVELGKAEPYFERLEQRLEGQDLPVWDGELYLEYHRGTYTSQARNKRANRQAEILYHEAEWLGALADILTRQDRYPAAELHQGWELILLNQFHDILPGSSIREVYEDSREDYAHIRELGERALAQAAQTILDRVQTNQESLVVFNSTSSVRTGLVELSGTDKTILDENGMPSPVQAIGENKVLVEVPNVPALGYQAYPLVEHMPPPSSPVAVKSIASFLTSAENEFVITPTHLVNRYYEIDLNAQGQVISLYDRVNKRQVLAAHARGNVLQTFEDQPMSFDAWDTDIYYQQKMREIDELVEAVVEEQGPLRGVLRLSWQFGDSTITQRLTLYRHSPRIDWRTEVDWHARQTLLKVAFPVDVRATHATYDIQFGNLPRANHWNTSWDYARFEVCAHKWADLSEGNYGVALLNDCKYGYDVKDNVLRLTLLKSAIEPDATADQGRHEFTYSLLPHAGGWREGRVVEEAYALNYSLHSNLIPAQPEGDLPGSHQFAQVDVDNVIVETVKQAEDGEPSTRAWIIRVYEYKQSRCGEVNLHFGQPLRQAVECNLMEEEERPVAFEGERLTFSITPYEIKTFQVWF